MLLLLKLTCYNLMGLWMLLSLTSALPHLMMKVQQDATFVMGSCASGSCSMQSKASPFCCQQKAVYRGGTCLTSGDADQQAVVSLAPACQTPNSKAVLFSQLLTATLTHTLTPSTVLQLFNLEMPDFLSAPLQSRALALEKIPIV